MDGGGGGRGSASRSLSDQSRCSLRDPGVWIDELALSG